MILPNKKSPVWIILTIDFLIINTSIILSFFIRFEFNFNQIQIEIYEKYFYQILVFVVIKSLSLLLFKVYQSIVRHTSIQDIKKIFYSILSTKTIAISLNILIFNLLHKPYFLPFSIIIVDFLISLFLILGVRFLIKVFFNANFNSTIFNCS